MPWPLKMCDEWPDRPEIGDTFQTTDTSGKVVWFVALPNGTLWNVYGPSSDGTPWDVTGEIPNITVTPSIFPQPWIRDGKIVRQGWHGYITNGQISDGLEGRSY